MGIIVGILQVIRAVILLPLLIGLTLEYAKTSVKRPLTKFEKFVYYLGIIALYTGVLS